MRLRDSFVILAACAAGYFGGLLSSSTSVSAAAPDVVRATRFELVNAMGNPVESWQVDGKGEAHMQFVHGQRAQATFGTSADGRPFLRMAGRDGKSRVVMELDQADKPVLGMGDEQWEGRLQLGFISPDTFPYSDWDHWGLLFRPVGMGLPVAGMGMTNTRTNPAEPFLTVSGKSIH